MTNVFMAMFGTDVATYMELRRTFLEIRSQERLP